MLGKRTVSQRVEDWSPDGFQVAVTEHKGPEFDQFRPDDQQADGLNGAYYALRKREEKGLLKELKTSD